MASLWLSLRRDVQSPSEPASLRIPRYLYINPPTPTLPAPQCLSIIAASSSALKISAHIAIILLSFSLDLNSFVIRYFCWLEWLESFDRAPHVVVLCWSPITPVSGVRSLRRYVVSYLGEIHEQSCDDGEV